MSGAHGQPGLEQFVGAFDLECNDSNLDDVKMTSIDLLKNEYFRIGRWVISFGSCIVFRLWVGLRGDESLCKGKGGDCLVDEARA